jgi:hypothetical protein
VPFQNLSIVGVVLNHDIIRGKVVYSLLTTPYKNYYEKSLFILLCAGSIALAGCGNSAGASKDATAAANTTAPSETTSEEEASMFFFPEAKAMMPKETVDEAIADVMNGTVDYAVIPQENTLGGAVTNYVDALIKQNDAFVIGEVILPISQTLMGVPGAKIEDIKTVCSHAQRMCRSQTPTRPGSMFFRPKSPRGKHSRTCNRERRLGQNDSELRAATERPLQSADKNTLASGQSAQVFHGGFDGILIRGTDYDQNKVNEMFDLAIKEGVNYFDLYCRAKEYGF